MQLGRSIDSVSQALGLTAVPIPAGSFVLGTWKEGWEYPDWCNVSEFGWGQCPGFRRRGFSCLCHSQSRTVGLQSDAGTSPGPNPDLLCRNELQHGPVVKSALAGHCWGSGKQHLLGEWPCTGPVSRSVPVKAAQSGTYYFVKRTRWHTEIFLPDVAHRQHSPGSGESCLLHIPLVLSEPFITLSKSAPAPGFWYQYNINLSWVNITY